MGAPTPAHRQKTRPSNRGEKMNQTTVSTMPSAARRLFIPAAIFNWSVAGGLLLLSDVMGPLLQLDPASGTNLALRDISMLLVALFGFAYWRIAFDPQRFRPYIELGILGKSLVVAAIYSHWLAGHIGWQLPAVAFGDAVFALLFLNFLHRYPA